MRAATAAGKATVNIDRIGSGESSHPDPAKVDTEANAYMVHQVVQALRGGEIGRKFKRVLLVGHSYGSAISVMAAAKYETSAGCY